MKYKITITYRDGAPIPRTELFHSQSYNDGLPGVFSCYIASNRQILIPWDLIKFLKVLEEEE